MRLSNNLLKAGMITLLTTGATCKKPVREPMTGVGSRVEVAQIRIVAKSPAL